MGSPPHSVILVSGAPASGKSTLAEELARIIGYPLLSKDTIKESLFDSFEAHLGKQIDSPAELSRLLSRAAMDVLWSLAPHCPNVILEANFRPKSDYERARIASLDGRKLEVYCHCTPEEAARRYRTRAVADRHHPAHSMKSLSRELLAEFDGPIGLCPVIEIDTERTVDPTEVADRIRRRWSELRS